MILIFSQFHDDITPNRVVDRLRERGSDVVLVASSTLTRPSGLRLRPNGGPRPDCILELEERAIDLREVGAAWLWRPWQPHVALHRQFAAERPEEWQFFHREWQSFHRGVSMVLRELGVFCVNPPPWGIAYEEKASELLIAAEAGLSVPPTLSTASMTTARAFCDEHRDGIIYKPHHAFTRMIEPEGDGPWRAQSLLTNRVAPEHLVEVEGMLPTPGVFQPYVSKAFELRVVVVGRRLLACRIDSQSFDRTREDWRRYYDGVRYEPYTLPEPVAAGLLALVERMHLNFGSIDMIVTPEGEHVFLEINPMGQFDFVAAWAGLPIYEHLVAMLEAGSVDYRVEDAALCSSR